MHLDFVPEAAELRYDRDDARGVFAPGVGRRGESLSDLLEGGNLVPCTVIQNSYPEVIRWPFMTAVAYDEGGLARLVVDGPEEFEHRVVGFFEVDVLVGSRKPEREVRGRGDRDTRFVACGCLRLYAFEGAHHSCADAVDVPFGRNEHAVDDAETDEGRIEFGHG